MNKPHLAGLSLGLALPAAEGVVTIAPLEMVPNTQTDDFEHINGFQHTNKRFKRMVNTESGL